MATFRHTSDRPSLHGEEKWAGGAGRLLTLGGRAVKIASPSIVNRLDKSGLFRTKLNCPASQHVPRSTTPARARTAPSNEDTLPEKAAHRRAGRTDGIVFVADTLVIAVTAIDRKGQGT